MSDELMTQLFKLGAFTIGAYGFVHDINAGIEHPYLIPAYLVLMGFLPADIITGIIARRRNGNGHH